MIDTVYRPRPLSQQQRLMMAFIDPRADSYYLSVLAFRVGREIDLDALRRAVEVFALANPSACSVFESDREVPSPELVHTIWESGAPAESEEEALSIGAARVGRPLDLFNELPIRWWSAPAGDDVVVMLAAHHIVFDAWAIGLMLEAVGREYRTPGTILPIPAPAPVVAGAESMPADLDTLLGRPYTAVRAVAAMSARERTAPANTIRVSWPELSIGKLRPVARTWRTTPFTLAAAAALGALQDLLGDQDVILGSASAGRTTEAELDHIGYYSTTIFLGSAGKRELPDLIAGTVLQTREWQRRPRLQWEPLLEKYDAKDLYPIKFGFQDSSQGGAVLNLGPAVPSQRISSNDAPARARRPIDALLGCGPEGTNGVVTWRTDVFDEQDIQSFLDGIRHRLKEITQTERAS